MGLFVECLNLIKVSIKEHEFGCSVYGEIREYVSGVCKESVGEVCEQKCMTSFLPSFLLYGSLYFCIEYFPKYISYR